MRLAVEVSDDLDFLEIFFRHFFIAKTPKAASRFGFVVIVIGNYRSVLCNWMRSIASSKNATFDHLTGNGLEVSRPACKEMSSHVGLANKSLGIYRAKQRNQ